MEENNEIMNGKPQSEKRYYRPAIKRLRLILMFFMCIELFGFPTALGGIVQTVCGFVPMAFFILSGYLVLRESETRSKRIVRAIRRSAIAFGILAAVYFAINFFYYRALGVNIFHALAGKRIWFNFIVLNVWPFDIGSVIWYVQALLYAYIILYFLNKWNLLRYDWLIAAVLIVFAVVTGELAGVIRWEFLGYQYVPGNFLTRALPYVLLGSFIHRKMDKFKKVCTRWYLLAIIGGIVLTVAEPIVLGVIGMPGYYGHLIGYGVIAAALCILAFLGYPESGFEFTLALPRQSINCIYYLCQPVSVGIALLMNSMGNKVFAASVGFIGILTFAVCFFLIWVAVKIVFLFLWLKDHGKKS